MYAFCLTVLPRSRTHDPLRQALHAGDQILGVANAPAPCSRLSHFTPRGHLPCFFAAKDPLEAIRITAVWEGLGSDRPLPHANLELLGDPLEGNSFDWNAMVTWNKVTYVVDC